MSDLGEHFKIDISLGKSNPKYIFQGKKYRITVLSDVLLRLEYSDTGKFNDYPTLFAINRLFKNEPKITVKEDDKFLNIRNNYFILEYAKEKPFEASKLVPDTNLRISLKDTDKVWYYNHPEVRNFKGSTYSFDSGKNFKLDKGLYSTDGFASINDTDRPVFVGDGTVKKNPSDGVDIYLFIYRKDFGKALQSYFELTGYPTLPPRYALGIWWNKSENYKDEDLKNLVENFKKREIPLSTILLSDTWKKRETNDLAPNYEFNRINYINPKELIEELHDKKIYFGLNLKTDKGFNNTDKFYEEAKKLANTKDEIIPLNVYNTKMLNAFYEQVINPLLDLGVDYFWIDDNIKDKINLFMLVHYTSKNYNRKETRRSLIMSRNHGIAAHRYPILYSGNTQVSWKTLKYLPYYNATSSNIGLSWWSHDIGGYENGTEDRELYTRFVQLGVYSPIFRFSSKIGRYYKREPWKWDVKTENIAIDYIKVRHRLIPYIYTEGYKYTRLGAPLIQPIYYKYPETVDEPLYKNEYFFGSELFVSPITDPKDSVMNRVVHRIFLPEGTWYDFKTGKKFPGGKRYVTFYKDEDYPVYAKSGSIIPLAILDEENLNDVRPPKQMEIQVFPGKSNTYNLYEDDGVSNLYKEGYYIITNIDYNYRQNNYTLIIRPVEGKSGIIPEKRDYKIRFRNTKHAEYVKTNVGRFEVEHHAYTDETDFIIEIKDVPTIEQLTVNCGGKAIEIDAVRLINEDIDEIISDLQIETKLKETIADIIFSDKEIRKKRIEIRKLRTLGLKGVFVKMFIKLLEYISEI
jgi:alpha-glucosidase (family GH31 glycosyl hydrolase)